MAARETNTQRSIKTAIIRAPSLPELEGVDSLLLLSKRMPSDRVAVLTAVAVAE